MTTRKWPVKLLNVLIYVLAGIAFFHLLTYLFTDAISSFPNAFTLIPLCLILTIPIYFLFLLNIIPSISDPMKRNKQVFIHSIVGTAVSGLSLILLIVAIWVEYDGAIIAKQYTSYFPLDFIIYSIIVLLLSVGMLVYSIKEKKEIAEAEPIEVEETEKIFTGKVVWLKKTLAIIYLLFALYFLGQGIIGLFTIDIGIYPENLLGSIIMVILCFVPSVYIGLYYLGYIQSAKNKRKFMRISLISALGGTILLLILYIVQYAINPQFIVESLQSFLPADFAASVKLGFEILFILAFAPIIYFGIYEIVYLVKEKREKTEQKE